MTSKEQEAITDLFPISLTIKWSDGSTEDVPFNNPTQSAKGNLNAHAGDKINRSGEMLRINCNVTKVRG